MHLSRLSSPNLGANLSVTLLALLLSTGLPPDQTASAVTFERVVSLGDSLLDDNLGTRSPVAAQHVADRLGAPLTKLARSGATSTALINQNQHTDAAAQFGSGDLAMLWIGGNDVFTHAPGITFGSYDNFLTTLEANVDTALGTLRDAGMDVIVFNLPDFAEVPAVANTVASLVPLPFLRDAAMENFTQAARFWNHRLDELAQQHGVAVVNVFDMLADVVQNPADYDLLGNLPEPSPPWGCQFCLFADPIHPSAFVQGILANGAIDVLNETFDPAGEMPLTHLNEIELSHLAGLIAADFDESNSVDRDDLKLWAGGYGASGDLPHSAGEANGDGLVGGADILVWQQQYRPNDAPVAAVPEPGPAALLTLLTAVGCLPRRVGAAHR